MDPQTARTVLYAITAAACTAWIIGLVFVWRSRDPRSAESSVEAAADFGEAIDPGAWVVTGVETVDSAEPDLHRKAARLLAEGRLGMPLKVTRCDERELVFEPAMVTRWMMVRRGIIRFEPAGFGKTNLRYAMFARGSGRRLLWLAWLFQGLGLLAIGIGFWAISTYVINHPNPPVRVQSVQMVQTIHFLWPPFLFAGLYRSFRRGSRNLSSRLVDALAHNLPYVE